MLTGIRKAVLDRYKKEKERSLTENIQYDSISRFNDRKFLDKKIKKVGKSSYMKQKYKYKDMKSKQLGKFKDGILNLSKKDYQHIEKNK